MRAFFITDESVMSELQRTIRNAGATLVSKNYTCWIAYYYQTVFTNDQIAGNPDTSVPVFSVLGDDAKDSTYIVSEEEDQTPVMPQGDELFVAPFKYTDISEMNYMFFDKVKIFNLKNKRVKKLDVVLMHFNLDGIDILLGDNFLLIKSEVVDEKIMSILTSAETSAVRNLEKHIASLRNQSFVFQFYIYWLFKMRDTITIPRQAPVTKDVTYADCVFVKDSILV